MYTFHCSSIAELTGMCVCAGSNTQGIAYFREMRLSRLGHDRKVAYLVAEPLLGVLRCHADGEEVGVVAELADAERLSDLQRHRLLPRGGRQPPELVVRSFCKRHPVLDAAFVEKVKEVLAFEGQIRLEVEDAHRLGEHRDGADRGDVAVQKLVRVAHVSRDERVEADDLRAGAGAGETTTLIGASDGACAYGKRAPRMQQPPLRALLFGSPMCGRADDARASTHAIGERLDALVDDVVELLRGEHTDASRAFRQAEREIAEIRAMPADDPHAVACKRGVVLFALWREPSFAARFSSSAADAADAALLADLTARVLPLAAPSFLQNLGQRPDSFAALCATLCTLWPAEPLALKPGWERGEKEEGGV